FLFGDVISGKSRMSANSGVLFIAALCAAGMSIVGYPRKKTVEFGIAGFIVGGLVAFVGLRSTGAKPIVRTQFGSYSHHDLTELRNRRSRAEQFLVNAAKKIGKD